MSVDSQPLISALGDFPWSHFFWPFSVFRTHTLPHRVTFQQSFWPLASPAAWPPGNKGTCCPEMAIMYLHSPETPSPGGEGTGWQGTIPPFIPSFSHPHPFHLKTDQGTPGRRGWRASAQGDRDHKVQLSLGCWAAERLQGKENRFYSSSKSLTLTVQGKALLQCVFCKGGPAWM